MSWSRDSTAGIKSQRQGSLMTMIMTASLILLMILSVVGGVEGKKCRVCDLVANCVVNCNAGEVSVGLFRSQTISQV